MMGNLPRRCRTNHLPFVSCVNVHYVNLIYVGVQQTSGSVQTLRGECGNVWEFYKHGGKQGFSPTAKRDSLNCFEERGVRELNRNVLWRKCYLEGDVTHGFHPFLGGALLRGEHVRLVVGLHTEGRHVFFGTGLRQRGQDGDALGQADDLFVQLPGFLVGAASRAPAAPRASRGRVEKLEAGDAVLAGGVQNKPVLLPFLRGESNRGKQN